MNHVILFALVVVGLFSAALGNPSPRLTGFAPQPFSGSAPREMPQALRAAYTLNGTIEEHDFYIDETNGGQGVSDFFWDTYCLGATQDVSAGSHIRYSQSDIEQLIVGAITYQRKSISLLSSDHAGILFTCFCRFGHPTTQNAQQESASLLE